MNRVVITALTSILAMAILSRDARADLLYIHDLVDGTGGSKIGTIHFHEGTHGVDEAVYIDPLIASYRSYNSPTFQIYCVDILHNIGLNSIYNVEPTSSANPGLANHDLIAKLMNTYGGTVTDSEHRAALQLAIWKALCDGYDGHSTDVFGNGSFTVTGVDASLIDDAVGYLQGASRGPSVPLTWLDPTNTGQDGGQGMVVGPGGPFGPLGGGAAPVPEPSSAILLIVGALSAAGLRMRSVIFRTGRTCLRSA